MNREEPADEILSVDELTDELADATGTTPEEIERGAEDVDMAPPVDGDCRRRVTALFSQSSTAAGRPPRSDCSGKTALLGAKTPLNPVFCFI